MWILNSYANGFKKTEDKQKFLSTKISEVLENINQQVDIDRYNMLKEETIVELACGVNFFGKKTQKYEYNP
jgi:signal recognition particle GTPase